MRRRNALLLAVSAVVVVLVVFTALAMWPARAEVRVEKKGFEMRGIDTLAYLAHVYIDGKIIRNIYAVIPLYYETRQPLRIHVAAVEGAGSTIKSLKIVFKPLSPERVLELAWLATTLSSPVKYYQEGWSTVWWCDNLDTSATLTLEFTPLHPKPDYFAKTSITLTITLNYNGRDYTVTDVIVIDTGARGAAESP